MHMFLVIFSPSSYILSLGQAFSSAVVGSTTGLWHVTEALKFDIDKLPSRDCCSGWYFLQPFIFTAS